MGEGWTGSCSAVLLLLSLNDGCVLQLDLTLSATELNMQLAQDPGNMKEEPLEAGASVGLAVALHEPADKQQAKG